ncbi:MAG: aminotransferase class V-fold PLP-dependent enzyme [Firmicutes bacterium]|nr:aminotransferase class V-fold PLP-dependent enzyme [Bacillota bacterium]
MQGSGSRGRLFPESLMKEIRSKFLYVDACPYAGRRIFFDSASGSLRLKQVVDVVQQEVALPDQLARPSQGSKHAGEVMERGEDDVRVFIGAKSGVVVPDQTATRAIFRFVTAAAAHFPGTNIVTTGAEHPSVYDSTWLAAQTFHKEWRVAPFDPATGVVTPESILDLVDKDTSVLVFLHGANVTGAYMDAATIVREARRIKDDLCVIIDGVQYAPHAPIDVEEIQPDVYVIGPYKANCKKGIAFAWLSDRFSVIPHDKLRGKKANDWVIGSVDHADYAAWSTTVDYFCWLGRHFTSSKDRRQQVLAAMTAIEAHEMALLDRLLEGSSKTRGLRRIDRVTLYCLKEPIARRACLIPFNIRGVATEKVVKAFVEKGIAISARWSDAYSRHVLSVLGTEAVVRLSACHYTSPEEVDSFLLTTEEVCESL